jgi:hypothetical protein
MIVRFGGLAVQGCEEAHLGHNPNIRYPLALDASPSHVVPRPFKSLYQLGFASRVTFQDL